MDVEARNESPLQRDNVIYIDSKPCLTKLRSVSINLFDSHQVSPCGRAIQQSSATGVPVEQPFGPYVLRVSGTPRLQIGFHLSEVGETPRGICHAPAFRVAGGPTCGPLAALFRMRLLPLPCLGQLLIPVLCIPSLFCCSNSLGVCASVCGLVLHMAKHTSPCAHQPLGNMPALTGLPGKIPGSSCLFGHLPRDQFHVVSLPLTEPRTRCRRE